ncbi:MAG TPA: putative lipopolysaccharide heptosyltransferase III [Chlamydiales bacterium]|nr:putative lipopolysaccharide heptosyltransferase III [Chlamydiales bacterium]
MVKLRHLGDVLLSTPVFFNLKNALPDAQIDACVYEDSIPLLEGHPAIHEIIPCTKGSFIRSIRAIRKKRYDLVMNLTEGDRGVLIAYFSGAKIRVSFPPKGKWQKKLVTHTVKQAPGLRHTVERNLDALRCIGIFPEKKELFFAIDPIQEKGPYILIHPTSRWRFKCWPVKKMRELITQLSGKRIILTSGPDPIEISMVQDIAKGLDVEVKAGRTTLKEFGALVKGSEVLICVDSVPLHIASALKHPVVAIFGPTSDVTWGPWKNPNARIVAQNFSCRPCYQDGCGGSKYSDCLETLSVDRVLSELEIFTKITCPRLPIRQELIYSSCE